MKLSTTQIWVTTALCAVFLFGCSSSSDDAGSQRIGSEGGSVTALNANGSTATLTVPASSMARTTEISIRSYPVDGLSVPEGLQGAEAWIVTPHGLVFDTPAALSIRMVTAPTGDLVVARLDDENDTTWEFMTDVQVSGGNIDLSVSSLSIYVVMAGTDGDGDGVPDGQDAFPGDPSESVDSDGDGVGDNGDVTPNDATQCGDSDGDSCDDCSSGAVDLVNDGTDSNSDGLCDACDTASCSGNGACKTASGAVVCECNTGSAGGACDGCDVGYQDNDGDGSCSPACDAETCSGSGVCDDTAGTAVCTCDAAYAGDACAECAVGFQDNDANGDCQPDCTGNDCSSHGTCDDSSGTASCLCDAGYTGTDCSGCGEGFQDRDANGLCEPACDVNTCSGNGSCSDATGTATCTCNSGYAGTDCATCAVGYQDNDANGVCEPSCNVDSCSGNGTCSDASGSAACTCSSGYAGGDCSVCDTGYQDNDANGSCELECAAGTCSGNGSCSDATGTTVCTCDAGYSGADCSGCGAGFQDRDGNGVCQPACDANTCSGNGTCDDSSGTAMCTCSEGYADADCSACATGYQDNDNSGTCEVACSASSCSGHGTCSDVTGTVACTCDTGYAGVDCSTCALGYQDNDNNGTCEVECTGTTCSGHGTCSDASGMAVCTCDSGYTGADCSGCDAGFQDKDANGSCLPACGVNTCSGQGACDDSSGTATCTCNLGYTGADCSACDTGYQDNDSNGTCEASCSAGTCSSHGTCSDASGTATCSCDTGYTGTDCSTCATGYQDNDNDGTCAPDCTTANPNCSGNGTCNDASGAAVCDCNAGWTGADCSVSVPGSCLEILNNGDSTGNGDYLIDAGAGPITVYCDMTTDGGGYTSYQVTGGISTSRFDQANSCQALGMELVVPRTEAHFTALLAKWPGSFATVPGIYSPTNGGNYTSCAMNSGSAGLSCPATFDWQAIDGGAWWLRDTAYGEPNGDYTAGCWLSFSGSLPATFNDGNCNYATGGTYVCSTNDKDVAPTATQTFTFTESAGDDIAGNAVQQFLAGLTGVTAADWVFFDIPGSVTEYGGYCFNNADWMIARYLAHWNNPTEQLFCAGDGLDPDGAGPLTTADSTVGYQAFWHGPGAAPYSWTSVPLNNPACSSAGSRFYVGGADQWLSPNYCQGGYGAPPNNDLCLGVRPARTTSFEIHVDNPAAYGTVLTMKVGSGGASRLDVCGF